MIKAKITNQSNDNGNKSGILITSMRGLEIVCSMLALRVYTKAIYYSKQPLHCLLPGKNKLELIKKHVFKILAAYRTDSR